MSISLNFPAQEKLNVDFGLPTSHLQSVNTEKGGESYAALTPNSTSLVSLVRSSHLAFPRQRYAHPGCCDIPLVAV